MIYSQIKKLRQTTDKAATDLHEMKRQYAIAVRDCDTKAITKLSHSVRQLELAHELLLELVNDLG